MKNASGHQCKVKMSGSEKKGEREHLRHFLPKKDNLGPVYMEVGHPS